MKNIKIGLDIHGVIDKNPEFFIAFAKLIKQFCGEIHIITGTPLSEAENQLLSYNNGIKWWDHFFSIDDYLYNNKKHHKKDDRGRRIFDSREWDSAKAKYCLENKINLHIDDSEKYEKFFSTPYFCVKDTLQN